MGYKWGILVTDTTNVSVEYMKYNKCVFSINEASKSMHGENFIFCWRDITSTKCKIFSRHAFFKKTTIIPAEPTEILNKKQLAMIQIHEADYMPRLHGHSWTRIELTLSAESIRYRPDYVKQACLPGKISDPQP